MSNILHHISFAVSDLEASGRFYDAALSALGFRRVVESGKFVGYGVEDNKDKFAIAQTEAKFSLPEKGFHLAFTANSEQEVHDFHSRALQAGGKCNGLPGLRENYGPNYYAAFVIDPDGYKLEVVFK